MQISRQHILPFCIWLCGIASAQPSSWHTFGDFPFLSVPVEGLSGLTNGYLQPNRWVEPSIKDTVVIADEYIVFFDRHEAASPYAPFAFDTVAAIHSGWYTYYVDEPYHNGIHPDSIFVLFIGSGETGGNDTSDVGPKHPTPKARIVNLVILDELNLTRFRILNLDNYDRADVCLFDRSGRAIYRSRGYKNDFDFAGHTPDTYYYRVVLHRQGAVIRQEGFVEVI